MSCLPHPPRSHVALYDEIAINPVSQDPCREFIRLDHGRGYGIRLVRVRQLHLSPMVFQGFVDFELQVTRELNYSLTIRVVRMFQGLCLRRCL